MLTNITPSMPKRFDMPGLDNEMSELLRAASIGVPLERVMTLIMHEFGFESFAYAMTTDPKPPQQDGRSYVWTTLPREWVALYDKSAFLEVDPRVRMSLGQNTPIVWDSASLAADERSREFLEAAAKFGTRSGVAYGFSDANHHRLFIAMNSSISPVCEHRRLEIEKQLGKIMIFGARFHDLFMANVVTRGARPVHYGTPLSPRERQCLKMAAHGMTSADIGFKLGITERAVNFHFSNLISKLDVLNRKEAIGKALSQSIIETNY